MTRALSLAVAAALAAFPAHAQPVELWGKVGQPMFEKVDRALKDGRRAFSIDSPGGGTMWGVSIGYLLRRHNATLTVVGRCESACFSILMGALHRYALPGAKIGTHGVRGAHVGTDDGWTKAAASQLQMWGMPADMLDRVHAINVRHFSDAELQRLNVRVLK